MAKSFALIIALLNLYSNELYIIILSLLSLLYLSITRTLLGLKSEQKIIRKIRQGVIIMDTILYSLLYYIFYYLSNLLVIELTGNPIQLLVSLFIDSIV